MLVNSSVEIDIREIIERKGIDIHFQPIISLRKQRRVGVEALARAAGPGGTLVSPAVLFGRAAAEGLTVELDRLCWRTALERFAPLHTADPQVILFINFDPASLIAGAVGPDGLIEQVERLGIDPRNVAIEILETAFGDADRMRESITRFKRSGFLVVLDDVGIGQSNFDRILFVRPDILKTDRSLTHDLSREYMKREIFRAIVKLSEKIGGWTITEGIETEEEALVALDLGGDMLQGFLFGRPAPLQSGDSFGNATPPMQSVAAKFRDYTMKKVTTARSQRERRIHMVRSLGRQLGGLRREEWEGVLAEERRRSLLERIFLSSTGRADQPSGNTAVCPAPHGEAVRDAFDPVRGCEQPQLDRMPAHECDGRRSVNGAVCTPFVNEAAREYRIFLIHSGNRAVGAPSPGARLCAGDMLRTGPADAFRFDSFRADARKAGAPRKQRREHQARDCQYPQG